MRNKKCPCCGSSKTTKTDNKFHCKKCGYLLDYNYLKKIKEKNNEN